MDTSKTTSSSSATESSSESDNEKTRKTTARRNYLRAHATPNMRTAGIYNGALLNHYRQQQQLYQHQQHQQQLLYRQSLMQGYDNYAYSRCSYVPNYYGQYATQSNCSYQQQYLSTPTKIQQYPSEYLTMRYALPMAEQPSVRYSRNDQQNCYYAYYDYRHPDNTQVQTICNGYNYPSLVATKQQNQNQNANQKNSSVTTLNCDYNSQNSVVMNDVPTYEMTQNQQMQTNEQLKRAASENSLRFINIAAVGGTANLGSNHSLNKTSQYGGQDLDMEMNHNEKGKINFLNFEKHQQQSKWRTRIAVIVILALIIAITVILASVLGTVLPQKERLESQKGSAKNNTKLISNSSDIISGFNEKLGQNNKTTTLESTLSNQSNIIQPNNKSFDNTNTSKVISSQSSRTSVDVLVAPILFINELKENNSVSVNNSLNSTAPNTSSPSSSTTTAGTASSITTNDNIVSLNSSFKDSSSLIVSTTSLITPIFSTIPTTSPTEIVNSTTTDSTMSSTNIANITTKISSTVSEEPITPTTELLSTSTKTEVNSVTTENPTSNLTTTITSDTSSTKKQNFKNFKKLNSLLNRNKSA